MRTVDPARGEQILESAARLFHRRHYHEVRMDDVAADAGVAKGTLYRYFQDKEDLYLALILSSVNRFIEEISPIMHESGPAEERLRSYIRRAFRFCDRNPYFLDLVQRVEGASDPQRLEPLQVARRKIVDMIAVVVTELDVPRPDIAAIVLTGMIRQVMRFLPKPWPEELPEIVADQFLFGQMSRKKHP